MDDDVAEGGEARHQSVFDDMRCAMRRLERCPAVEPQMKVHEDVIGGHARSDLVAPKNIRHGGDYLSNVVFGDNDLVAQNPRRLLRDLPACVTDECRYEKGRERVEQRITPPDSQQRPEHRSRCQYVTPCML